MRDVSIAGVYLERAQRVLGGDLRSPTASTLSANNSKLSRSLIQWRK